MEFYISLNNRKTIRKNYPKLIKNKIAFLEISVFAKQKGYENYKEDIYQEYLLYREIKKKLNNFYRSKRFKKIIYIIESIDQDFIYDIKKFFEEENIYFTNYILIDYDDSIDHNLYNYFDTVI